MIKPPKLIDDLEIDLTVSVERPMSIRLRVAQPDTPASGGQPLPTDRAERELLREPRYRRKRPQNPY